MLLPELIEKAPESAALCIVHSHTLNQFSERARAAFARLLQSVSKARPVYEVSAEHDRLTLFRYAAREGSASVVRREERPRSMGGVVTGTWFSLLQMLSFTDGDSCLTTFLGLTVFPLMPLNLC